MKEKLVAFLIIFVLVGKTLYADDIKIGTDIGDVVETDIQAQIDECFIPSYSINGELAILTKDLSNYGFDVTWDNKNRKIASNRIYLFSGKMAVILKYKATDIS